MPASSIERLERDDHLHRRAVGVGDDPAVAVDRVGVDLGDDQRHVVVHAPVAGVVDDDGARLDQLRRPLGADRAAGRGEDEVEALDRLRRSAPGTRATVPFHSICLPTERSEAKGTSSATGKSRSASTLEDRRADQPGRAQHSDSVAVAVHDDPSGARGCGGGWRSAPASTSSSKASCSARTASGTRSAEITHEILIGEVEIISMLIPSPPRTSKTLAATPGCERMPAPTIETLPIRSSVLTPRLSRRRARRSCRSPWSGRRGRP